MTAIPIAVFDWLLLFTKYLRKSYQTVRNSISDGDLSKYIFILCRGSAGTTIIPVTFRTKMDFSGILPDCCTSESF